MRPRAPSPVVWRILPLLAALGSALVSPGKSPAAQACLTTGAHAKHSGANCTACHLVPGAPCFDSAGPAAAPGQPAPAFDAAAKTCANVACHGLAATPAWNSGASLGCNGCHGTHTTNGAPDYPSGSPKANSHSVHPYACDECHAATTSNGSTITNTSLHGNGFYNVDPGPGISFTYTAASNGGTCAGISCHAGGSAKWGPTTAHVSNAQSGEIVMFNQASTHDITPLSVTEDCGTCHDTSLIAQHAANCTICHAGTNPAATVAGTWNKTCSQGSCHATIHSGMQPDHFGMYWNSSAACEMCHDGWAASGPGEFRGCQLCHDPSYTVGAVGDHQAPVTTSDARSTYTGIATVRLTATDQGTAGVSTIRYSLSYGARTYPGFDFGSQTAVVVNPSRTTTYTLTFHAQDHALNVETDKTVTFTVTVPVTDTTPPTTTSSFIPAAGAVFKTAQPVTLTAADNAGGSGVKATYYKVDNGAYAQGTSFTVAGDGLHTFSYYSVDNANVIESTHVSNQFRIDTTAPVTTCSAVNGSTYTGAQVFTLAASDTGGSGVASTRYQLDGGAWTSGTSIPVAAPSSGSASHTLSWYSQDVATNTESARSVTFTIQAPPDATPPTTTSSFNPTAGAVFKTAQPVTLTAADNAGGSGVKATYYKIDSGAFVQGTSFTVAGDGLHTFSYYSVDYANVTESTHVSNQFRIDTVAPSTTSTATNGATYTGDQIFTLSATDTGGSGVAGTWYRLDGGPWIPGTSIAVPAPASGTASHTLDWYSRDVAANAEGTRSVAFNITASAPAGGTTTLTAAVYHGDMHPYAHFVFYDESGQVIADSDWTADEHYNSFSFTVPSGHAYTLWAEWEIPDYEGGGAGSDSRVVSAAEATPGATVYWQTGP